MSWPIASASPLWVALIAFGVVVATGPFTIGYLQRMKFGQSVRTDGPRSHLQKSGTPSMGGVLILSGATIALVTTKALDGHLPMALFAMLGFGIVGFFDDLLNILTRKSLGLRARHKLIAELGIAGVIALYALTHPTLGPELVLPFSDRIWIIPPILYVGLVIGAVVGAANAVNITDGLDGLAAGTMAIASVTYGVVSAMLGFNDIAVLSAAVAGACLGFAWFNAHPAQVFMGDTGSLGLGAALAVMGIFTRTPLLLPIVGGLFVIETLSVIIQVVYFRLTGGKRIFKMAPIHHHFELKGWEEPKVMIRFWLLGLLFAALGLLAVL